MTTGAVPAAQAGKVEFSISLTSIEEVRAFCQVLAKSDMVPKAYKDKPDSIMVAGIMGREIGLPLMQSLQSIAVINGVPSIYGDAGLALVRGSGLLEDFEEWFEVNGERVTGEVPNLIALEKAGAKVVAFCYSKRKGMKPRLTSYSIEDAKTAKLWLKKGYEGKETPWCTTPGRMMMFRSRGFNLRDNFGDVLKGLRFFEEAMDIEPDTVDVTPQPEPPKTLGALLKASNSAPTMPPPPEAKPPYGEEPPPDETPAEPPSDLPPSPTPAPAPAPEPETKPDDSSGSAAVLPGISSEAINALLAHLAALNKTAKGRSLLAGLRKDAKLKAEDAYPSEPESFASFANGVALMATKVV